MKITKKLKKLEDELKRLVLQDYKHPVKVEARVELGPFGTHVMTACNPTAHPGTGMRRVLLDEDGSTYGIHGENDVADLIRRLQLDSKADTKLFLRLINIAYFEGIALLVNPEPRFTSQTKNLEFRFFRTLHPSGKRIEVVVQVAETGPAKITEK